MLNYNNVWRLVNQKYQELKTVELPYETEKILPCEIESDEIKALALVLIDELNRELKYLQNKGERK